jgi:hypothetical protein
VAVAAAFLRVAEPCWTAADAVVLAAAVDVVVDPVHHEVVAAAPPRDADLFLVKACLLEAVAVGHHEVDLRRHHPPLVFVHTVAFPHAGAVKAFLVVAAEGVLWQVDLLLQSPIA